MDLKWQLDNPAVTLERYNEDVVSFGHKKETEEVLKAELLSKESDLNSKRTELGGLKDKLQAMGVYVQGDMDSMIRNVNQNSDEKINKEQAKLEESKKRLIENKEKDILENDSWLEKRIKELLGDNNDANHELTEIEKKAVEFEIGRRKFIVESNERINGYQDAITQEDLDCKTVVGEWKQDKDVIFNKFEPNITKYKKIIDSINRKYQPDIRQCQNLVAEKIETRNEEIGQLQQERDREIQLANNEIAGYQKEYKQTEKQFNEQIRMAKLQSKPTTRMENSRTSRLNGINDQIQKINNRTNKKVASIEQKIDDTSNKHAKQIEKAETQLNLVIKNRDNELSSPTQTYNEFVQDRDGQLSAIQSKIDQRERECANKISSLNGNISNEKNAQVQHNSEIDQKIVEYVMSGDTCFSDVLDEANAPFISLQDKVSNWMELLSSIKKNKMSTAYSTEHEKQKGILETKQYNELQNEINEAVQFENTVSVLAKNNNAFTIAGGVISLVGVVMMIALYFILHQSVGLVGILVLALGVAIVVLTILKTNNEFSKICKYVSLASDYKEFPSISSHSTQVTQERELAKMKSIGNKLYDVHYGRAEAQSIHDAKVNDIKSDYDRNLKLLLKEFENVKAQLVRERDAEINKIKDDASDGEERFNSEKEELQATIKELTVKIENLDSKIRDLKAQISENAEFINAFEQNYKLLLEKLDDSNWVAPMEYTHGKLQNDLFIIPEKGQTDEYGHKKIYRINHNKKALVITYDISDLGDGDGSHIEKVGKIIHSLLEELMYSVYRMNSRESYAQFIVDEVVCTNDFKSTKRKNAFNIGDVVGKVEDVRGRLKGFSSQRDRLSEKGTQMDEINENKFKSQDRPEVYNLLYIIYKPDERKSKLDDEIRTLIPDCDKYGFLPIFICEKETWDREMEEKESMYKTIRDSVNNSIVLYDGIKYSEIN